MPGRFAKSGKYGSVDWREDCSRCTNCVKPRCIYDTYKKESAHNRDPFASIHPLNECRACLSCVQGCTKGILGIDLSPEYLNMGDEYWKPDILATTWNQAETGRIPVSGAGYRGRFSGAGFDSIWTDMSEIVRPTRDGIHGREYISTSVDVGTKPMRLAFTPDGKMTTPEASLIELQMPVILDLAPWKMSGQDFAKARIVAAKELKTMAVVRPTQFKDVPAELLPHVVPALKKSEIAAHKDILKQVRMAQLADGPDLAETIRELQAVNPALHVSVRVTLQGGSADRVVEIARMGGKVLHLCADLHGKEINVEKPRHLRDVLREIHGRLVKEGVRDEITLIAAGGIALAEHMAKAIICGADLVAIDVPLLVSVGCRVCRGAHVYGKSFGGNGGQNVPAPAANKFHSCPAEIQNADAPYATQRMVNLMGAWHSQLIEVLGAMGIREVRRLRGEVGRAIFLEDIEREAFSDLIRK